MLKAAGVENLEDDLWHAGYNPNAKRMAEMMQADLAKVGINVKLVLRVGRVPQALPGREQCVLLGWDRLQWRIRTTSWPPAPAATRVQNILKWCNDQFQKDANGCAHY